MNVTTMFSPAAVATSALFIFLILIAVTAVRRRGGPAPREAQSTDIAHRRAESEAKIAYLGGAETRSDSNQPDDRQLQLDLVARSNDALPPFAIKRVPRRRRQVSVD